MGALPTEAPRLLQKAFIVESDRPERGDILFGNTVCLGGYWLEGVLYLIGFQYPDGVAVAQWRPGWGDGEQPDLPEVDPSPLIEDVVGHVEWAREAAFFAIRLGVLLEARSSPLETAQPGKKKKANPRRGAKNTEWAIRRIRLSQPERRSVSADPPGEALDTTNRALQPVQVRGHLRRVAIGEGRTEREWRWIETYEGRRWVRPKIRIQINN